MSEIQGAHIHVTGVVQGVGFRPFVYGLAERLSLKGWVRNTSAGVDILVDGAPQSLQTFIKLLQSEAPPLARIDEIRIANHQADGFTAFQIIQSEPIPYAFQPISPDVGICPDCLRELFDPADRRYRYPFINCTHCGPRFTIIRDIPYDRPNTTMADFPLCPECAAEYSDPLDRRFHAQPVACPECGPQVWLERNDEPRAGKDPAPDLVCRDSQSAISGAQRLLAEGKIVAIKGLGGFHLACNAEEAGTVGTLRERKLRVDKPFALMMPDVETVRVHCYLNEAERQLLESRERPVLILRRRSGSSIAPQVAPGQDTLGVMLPYTPLHYLLFSLADGDHAVSHRPPAVLVMTSGNVSEEPIATENEEARQRLAGLADAFLMHNRPIYTRCDDSVVRVFDPKFSPPLTVPLRRSRGYAPFPVRLPWSLPGILAAGAELKNIFCLTRERYAFLSHHIGDLENYETLQAFEEGVAHFERIFRLAPKGLAYDLHPNYMATRYVLERARKEDLPAVGVQHHHAHIAACMVEHGLDGEQPVIGVAFDGTGYGADGAIWGGEFLLADYMDYRRLAHLDYIPLPGGDKAVREPWRGALAWLDRAGIEWIENLPPVKAALNAQRKLPGSEDTNPLLDALRRQLESGLNAPLTSSMGRLFDAAAAIAGVCQVVNYEAQAAIEFEARVDPSEAAAYRFSIRSLAESGASSRSAEGRAAWFVDPRPVVQALVADLEDGRPLGIIAARFHNGVAEMVNEVCTVVRSAYGISQVALSGGVWQNMTLLGKTFDLLRKNGFCVLIHRQVPANDGGLALGQAVIAGRKLLQEDLCA